MDEIKKGPIAGWLKVGRDNPWIRGAWDPAFDDESFGECKDGEHLVERLLHGNWCLGQAFYLGDLCLINQIDG